MAGAPKQGEARNGEDREDLVVVVPPGRGASSAALAQAWFPSPEKAVLEWPVLEDRLVEEES
jgi:hypothetical protein